MAATPIPQGQWAGSSWPDPPEVDYQDSTDQWVARSIFQAQVHVQPLRYEFFRGDRRIKVVMDYLVSSINKTIDIASVAVSETGSRTVINIEPSLAFGVSERITQIIGELIERGDAACSARSVERQRSPMDAWMRVCWPSVFDRHRGSDGWSFFLLQHGIGIAGCEELHYDHTGGWYRLVGERRWRWVDWHGEPPQ